MLLSKNNKCDILSFKLTLRETVDVFKKLMYPFPCCCEWWLLKTHRCYFLQKSVHSWWDHLAGRSHTWEMANNSWLSDVGHERLDFFPIGRNNCTVHTSSLVLIVLHTLDQTEVWPETTSSLRFVSFPTQHPSLPHRFCFFWSTLAIESHTCRSLS